ncbi:hypothetical protein RB653_003417 [Dictyostelium firmibasis]|uniref:RRM domain-containing protein n=1 Tax=Dictyostelium firmibasis TaxID=79012 RepID=A0AAN7TZ69_9MYCE
MESSSKKEVIDPRFVNKFKDDNEDLKEKDLQDDKDNYINNEDKEEEEEEEEEEEDDDDNDYEEDDENIEFNDENEDEDENNEEEDNDKNNKNKIKKVIKIKPMDIEKMKKLKEQNENKGIIYLSTIPSRMKPAKLKQLLTKYGKVTRMHLVRANVERKNHRNDMFKEGWIEFEDKALARKIATLLNNIPMGGKSRDIHKDCLWNLRYLPKFKWHHLQDKLVSQRMERDKKLRLEINQVRKQNLVLLEQVELSKHINQKHESKGKPIKEKVVRTFKQRTSHEDSSKSTISSNVLEKVVSNNNKKQKINH